jgi:hypothetical protein
LCVIVGEVTVRIKKLVPDIPTRIIDSNGIQKYEQNQSGYYTKSKTKWRVNKFGWLGVCDTNKQKIITIIGDSYIENIMNSIECNQGSLLSKKFKNTSFFEAARSGMTFIEEMEVAKNLNYLKPYYQIIYLGDDDFYESISNINRYEDMMQIDLKDNILLKGKMKNAKLKKILYNTKIFYFFWLRYSNIFNKVESVNLKDKIIKKDEPLLRQLFTYCQKYRNKNILLVFQPNTNPLILKLADEFGYKYLLLKCENETEWKLNSVDVHWSCYGHQEVSNQVYYYLMDTLKVK